MANCNITGTINGHTVSFKSDEEFDAYLANLAGSASTASDLAYLRKVYKKSLADKINTYSISRGNTKDSRIQIEGGIQHTNLTTLLSKITSENNRYSQMLNWLKEDTSLNGRTDQIKVVLHDPYSLPNGYRDFRMQQYMDSGGFYRVAYYDAQSRTIYINTAAEVANGDITPVVLHEVLHALTLNKLASGPEYVQKFQKIIDKYNEWYKDQFNHPCYRYRTLTGEYNVEEFVADIWSDESLITNLQKIDRDHKSLWDRIIDFIVSIFGDNGHSLFTEASDTLVDLIKSDIVLTTRVTGKYFTEVTAGVTPMEATRTKLSELSAHYQEVARKFTVHREKSYVDDLEEEDTAEILDRSISVSNTVVTVGNPKNRTAARVTGKSNDAYREAFIEKWLRDHKGMSEGHAERAYLQQEESGKALQHTGNMVHTIFENLFKEFKGESVTWTAPQQLFYNKYKAVFDKKLNDITGRFGKDAEYLTEFAIISKKLTPEISEALSKKAGKSIDTVNGRIDLLVIDDKGKAHIFDWKISSKKLGSWKTNIDNKILGANGLWSSTKRLTAFAQQGSYWAILNQWGIDVEDASLEPFYVEIAKDADGNLAKDAEGHVVISHFQEDISENGSTSNPFIKKEFALATRIYNFKIDIDSNSAADTKAVLPKLFPSVNFEDAIALDREDRIEWLFNELNGVKFWKRVPEGSEAYDHGHRFVFYTHLYGEANKPVYSDNLTQLRENIGKYIDELDSNKLLRNKMFMEGLNDVITSHGDPNAIENWLAPYSDASKTYLKHKFRKYWEGDWTPMTGNDMCTNDGVFIFVKKSSQCDLMDIVQLDEKDLHKIIPLTNKTHKNKNILGCKLDDGSRSTDPDHTLDSRWGNIQLIKLAYIISQNPEWGKKGIKINNISVVNPTHCSEVSNLANRVLIHSWNKLTLLNSSLGLRPLHESMFVPDVTRHVHNCEDLMAKVDLEFIGNRLAVEREERNFCRNDIISMMKQIYQKNTDVLNDDKFISDEAKAYLELSKALLAVNGWNPYNEENVGKYVLNGFAFMGLYVTDPAASVSVNVRKVAEIFSHFRENYSSMFNTDMNQFERLLEPAIKELGGTYEHEGDDIWAHFFEKDLEGKKVSRLMRLKDPQTFRAQGKPACAALVEWMSERFYVEKSGRRFGKADEAAKVSEGYYDIPLVEEGFIKSVLKGVDAEGASEYLKKKGEKCKTWFKRMIDVLSGEDATNTSKSRAPEQLREAPNPYLDMSWDERKQALEDTTVSYSLDLRRVFAAAMANAAITDASREFAPYFTGFIMTLKYAQVHDKLNIPEIVKFMEDYVNNRVFQQSIIDDSLRFMKTTLDTVKSLTSKMALGLSLRALTREQLVSFYIAQTRVHHNQMEGITPEDWAFGFHEVCANAPASLVTQGKIAALNRNYGMSNYGMKEMGDRRSRTKFMLSKLNEGDLFLTSSLTDDYHRMAILIAHMKHDGCYDAYVYDEDLNDWVYDASLDARYSYYLNNPVLEEVADKPRWRAQKLAYEQAWVEWKKSFPNLDPGSDKLPDAYTPEKKDSIRYAANKLFGTFDAEGQSLLKNQLLGAAVMQYKTWFAAKFNQWFKSLGFVNQWVDYQETDENGNLVFIVESTPEEIEEGKDAYQFISDTEENHEYIAQATEDGRCIPYTERSGTANIGMIPATYTVIKDLVTHDYDSLKEHWNDPLYNGQIKNGLWDMFGMMVLALLVQLIMGENNKSIRRASPIKAWCYAVLMGVANDGPVNQVLGSMFGDFNPPSLLTIKRTAETAHSVLSGSMPVGQGLLKSFGATRELANIWTMAVE